MYYSAKHAPCQVKNLKKLSSFQKSDPARKGIGVCGPFHMQNFVL